MASSKFELDYNGNPLPPRFFCNNDYTSWKTRFEEFIMFINPDLWIPIINRYERPKAKGTYFGVVLFKSVKLMDEQERKEFNRDKKAFETIKSCLSEEVFRAFSEDETSYDLWISLSKRFGGEDLLKLSNVDDRIKEESIQKDDELKALQSKVLIIETERDEMRLKIARMEEQILELQSQQTELIKVQEDHSLALKTIQDLRGQLSRNSHFAKQPEKVVQPAKVVKKIYISDNCEKVGPHIELIWTLLP